MRKPRCAGSLPKGELLLLAGVVGTTSGAATSGKLTSQYQGLWQVHRLPQSDDCLGNGSRFHLGSRGGGGGRGHQRPQPPILPGRTKACNISIN